MEVGWGGGVGGVICERGGREWQRKKGVDCVGGACADIPEMQECGVEGWRQKRCSEGCRSNVQQQQKLIRDKKI